MKCVHIRDQIIETDVFIVGGGLAGVNAAIGAAEKGARVLVADKGSLERSGDIGGGVDHFMAYLEEGESWDTRDAYLEYVARVARGAVNIKVHEKVFCDELLAAIERFARVGNPLSRPDGTYFRTKSMGQPGPYWINFEGKNLKPRLGKEARRLGVKTLEKTIITRLLVNDGHICGAIGFQCRTGEVFIIRAKAVILATGNTNRLFENSTGLAFNTWLCPADTGAAQVMAFEAGAALANMEYVRVTVVPKGFSAPGFNAFTGLGSNFINASHEDFMGSYHPLGNKAPRYKIAEGVMQEIIAGQSPVYIDSRHLSAEDMTHLKSTLGYDKDTLPDFIAQKGVDLAHQPLEVMLSEGMQAGPSEVCGSGVKIDENCAATVPGLFAAGDCADQMRCVHISTTGGYLAGKEAAGYAAACLTHMDLDQEQVCGEKERMFAPFHNTEGTPYGEIEDVLRKIMWQHAGPARSAEGLQAGLAKLEKLEPAVNNLNAVDFHELMRANETRDLYKVGVILLRAALYRQESRFGIYHNRIDFLRTDDDKWLGQVVVTGGKGQITTAFQPL